MFTALKHIVARLRAFFTSTSLDRDFERELETHVAMLTEDNVRRGMTAQEARRDALIRMGGHASLQEQHRAARGLPGIEAVLQDLRFALRLMSRDRGFSAAAVAALALGIGANATGFTIVNAAFLRGLPFEASDRLYTMCWQNRFGRRSNLSHAEFRDWAAQSRTFEVVAAYSDATMNISDGRALPEQLRGTWVTTNAFDVIAQPPLLGRGFAAGDDHPGAESVVIIGYGIWKDRYGADRDVLGDTLRINGKPATIVGVMPDGMKFPDNSVVWAPFIPSDAQTDRNARPLRVFGRIKSGVDRREAQTELSGIGRQLMAAYPDTTKDLTGVRVETFAERYIGGGGRPMLMTIMGAVVLVLLIGCANVANLLLSRSGNRAREIAIRTAMGATRWRVVRQLLIESLVLAFAGGSLGLLLAVAGVGAFGAAMEDSGFPYWVVFRMDYVVFAYVAAVCVLTAILFGLAPALHVSRTNHNAVLKEGGRGITGAQRQRRFTSSIVVAELALTTMLLAAAGVMIRSFVTLYFVDIGTDVERLMTMRLQLPGSKYPTPEARRAFFERLEPRLAAIPGVEAAAVTTGVPSRDGGERLLEIDRPALAVATPVFVSTVTITPRFFDAVAVPLVRGRNFHDRDGAPGLETVIVNERLAAQFFPGDDPIGRRLRFTVREPPPGRPPDAWRTVIGIGGRILHGSSLDRYENAVVYIPYRQESTAAASLIVRSALPPGAVMDAVRREVQAVDPDQPVLTIQTLAQVLAGDRWRFRTFGVTLGIFATVALVLCAVGLYAVTAYSVAQRTQEIGVRIALGAQRRQVSWLVLERGLVQLAIGLTLGLAGALALTRVLRMGLADIRPWDPITFAAIPVVLSVVSIAACLVPARRATKVDPMVALRES